MSKRYQNKKRCLLNTVEHLCYKMELNSELVRDRLSLGYSYKDAFSPKKENTGRPFKIYYRGKPAVLVAEELGIKKQTFYTRIYKGLTVSQALER